MRPSYFRAVARRGLLGRGSSVRPVFAVPGKGRHRCQPVAGVKAGASFTYCRLRGRLASSGFCPRRFRRAGGAGECLRRSTRRMSVPLLLRSFAVRIHAGFRVGFAAGGIRRLSGASIPWRRYRAGYRGRLAARAFYPAALRRWKVRASAYGTSKRAGAPAGGSRVPDAGLEGHLTERVRLAAAERRKNRRDIRCGGL